MECKHIICPETAHREQIDYESTPVGLIILGCSRFQPRCNVECARACARKIDRRERALDDDLPFADDEDTSTASFVPWAFNRASR